MNREDWLNAAATKVRLHAAGVGVTIPEKVRLSVGFPSKGALSMKRRTVGQCWQAVSSTDGHAEVFVSPVEDDPISILNTVTHELAHAATPGAGHRGAFIKVARRLGLVAPWRSTPWSDTGKAWAESARAELGAFPHARLNAATLGRKQSTRMLKLTCECGYTLRGTAKWLDLAVPECPLGHGEMERA
jgi:uncharacterized damage-inducible protein DinB